MIGILQIFAIVVTEYYIWVANSFLIKVFVCRTSQCRHWTSPKSSCSCLRQDSECRSVFYSFCKNKKILLNFTWTNVQFIAFFHFRILRAICQTAVASRFTAITITTRRRVATPADVRRIAETSLRRISRPTTRTTTTASTSRKDRAPTMSDQPV